MPLIITATDFSDVAENAVNYACSLATALKADVVILHSFIVPVMFSDIPMPVSLMNDAQGDADESMKKLVERCSATYSGPWFRTAGARPRRVRGYARRSDARSAGD